MPSGSRRNVLLKLPSFVFVHGRRHDKIGAFGFQFLVDLGEIFHPKCIVMDADLIEFDRLAADRLIRMFG